MAKVKKTKKKGKYTKCKIKRGTNFLYKYNKKLFKQLHPTKNEGIDLKKLTCGSQIKPFWLCEKGHFWDARVSSRHSQGNGCPYCAGQKVCLDNCLATVNPEVAITWHPTLNGDLTPFDVTYGANKKIFWLCDKG